MSFRYFQFSIKRTKSSSLLLNSNCFWLWELKQKYAKKIIGLKYDVSIILSSVKSIFILYFYQARSRRLRSSSETVTGFKKTSWWDKWKITDSCNTLCRDQKSLYASPAMSSFYETESDFLFFILLKLFKVAFR